MEKYKKSLIGNCIKIGILSTILIVIFIISGVPLFSRFFQGIKYSNKDISSLVSGSVSGFVGVAIGSIVMWLRAIKNPQKLNEMYIKEKDERELLIQQKTGSSTFQIGIYLLLIAMVISSQINLDICLTLFAVIILMLVIYLASYIYYRVKF